MKRVLIVAPHFAPVAAPDGQRARLLLPHLAALGWHATVLAVDPADVAAPREDALLKTLPPDADIHRVRATLGLAAGRRIGVGNLAWRALPALARAGSRLLRAQPFDLVYFSTTQFACLPLGRWWRRRHGVPYVVDLQDPWRNDYYDRPGAPPPPGGWKYRFASAFASALEGWTLKRASHVVSVSPRYLETLARRYPWFDPARGTVIPFGWSRRDFELAPPAPPTPHILYLGRVGDDMLPALRHLFHAYAQWRRTRAAASRIIWEFAGTSYDARATAEGPALRAAREAGVADDVVSQPGRIGYLAALARVAGARANLVLGSEDAAYSPSKIWPVLASRRPWLAVVHNDSVLAALLAPCVGDSALVETVHSPASDLGHSLFAWFNAIADSPAHAETSARIAPAAETEIHRHEAKTLAATHAALFDAVAAHDRS